MAELSSEGSVGTVQAEAAPASESATVTVDSGPEAMVTVESNPQEAKQTPSWKPNYEFSVKGKKQEFDEWIRSSVKDAETEKKARELMEKFYGFDDVRAGRDKYRTERDSYKADAEKLYGLMNGVSELVAKKDFETFFERWGISSDDIVKYAVQYADRQQKWTPEQKQAYEESRRLKAELAQTQDAKTKLETTFSQQQTAQRESELEAVVSHPEVAEFSRIVAERLGDEHGLRNEVIRLGQWYWQQYQRDMTPVELVRDLAKRYGYTSGTSQSQQSTLQTQSAGGSEVAAPRVVAPSTKPVIPNISGRGGSPVAKKPKSFADLKAIRSAMQGAGIE